MPEETEVDFDLDPIIPAIPVTVNCSAYCCLFPIPSELDGFGAPGEELDIPASELDEFNTLSIEERYVRLKSIQDPEESLNAWRETRNEELTMQAVNRYEVFLENQAPSTTNSSRVSPNIRANVGQKPYHTNSEEDLALSYSGATIERMSK